MTEISRIVSESPDDAAREESPAAVEAAAAARLADLAPVGLRSIDVVAWRDLDDPEAGGSELHAHEVMRRWAAAGLGVTAWTSRVNGAASDITRDGYRVHRRSGRYAVFPRTALDGLRGMSGDALVEIWNGMPFFSPLWSRKPRVVFLHHVHAEMWQMVLSPGRARLGHAIEHRVAPPLYRHSRIITLSTSARDELVEMLHIPERQVSVVPPGVDLRFSPGGEPESTPLVVAVGRLVPVKRFDRFIDAMVALKSRRPDLRAVIVGEGYERPQLEARRDRAGARDWLTLPGRLSDESLIDLYRRAWVVASTSVREGWGMTLTEAAACGIPAVATRIAGHLDAVVDGESGYLVDSVDELVEATASILDGPLIRRHLRQGALRHAATMRWDQTAEATLAALSAEVLRRR